MKPLLLFIQDENACKNWLSVCTNDCSLIENLQQLADIKDEQCKHYLLFIQINDSVTVNSIISLAQKGFGVVALSNTPNDAEGIKLFQNGIRGYANTFAAKPRIEQIISTVKSDSVWLGPSIMQAMFTSLMRNQLPNDGWKELLTDREIETTDLVLETKSNRQIAEALGITERTVKAHLRNVFEKLEVTDRLSLVLKIKNWS
ncbi:HTH luxR-type domain-containing protein [uncultured Thiomicrorhabdus sp.]